MANFPYVESSRISLPVRGNILSVLFFLIGYCLQLLLSFTQQRPPYFLEECLCPRKLSSRSAKYLKLLRLSSSKALTEPEPKTIPERKLLKVAIIGRTNAGKSTLINKILSVNVCGVSHKSHTTRKVLRTSFTENNTQIVFLDTPGLVTQKEISKFKLSSTFKQALSKKVVKEADIIGIIHEVREPRDIFQFPQALNQHTHELSESKPLFLVLNKVDLILDKKALTTAMESFQLPAEDVNRPKIFQNFSKVFFTSATQNIGVRDIIDYLLQQAKPGSWLFEADEIFNTPLNTLILELLRAHFLNSFPQEVPYSCKYEIEYLKENDLGAKNSIKYLLPKCLNF